MKFNIENFGKFTHIAVPKILMQDEYKDLKIASKLTYGLFLSRYKLSCLNRDKFQDEEGNIFIIYTGDELKRCLNVSSRTTISKVLRDLESKNLIKIKRHFMGGNTFVNRIYLKNIYSIAPSEFLNENTLDNLMHYQVPFDLIRLPLYMNMSADAKLLYGILFDYIKLSHINYLDYSDENGDIYSVVSTKDLAEILNCSKPKVKKLLDELTRFDLLESSYTNNFTKKLKIYLKQPKKAIKYSLSTSKKDVSNNIDIGIKKCGHSSNCNEFTSLKYMDIHSKAYEEDCVSNNMDIHIKDNEQSCENSYTSVEKNMDGIYIDNRYINQKYINQSQRAVAKFKENIEYDILTGKDFDYSLIGEMDIKNMEITKSILLKIIRFLEDAFLVSEFTIGKTKYKSSYVIELILSADIYKIEEIIGKVKENIGGITNFDAYIRKVTIDILENYDLYFERNLAKIISM